MILIFHIIVYMDLKKLLLHLLKPQDIPEKIICDISNDIAARYSESHRQYHTLEHIDRFLNVLSGLSSDINDYRSLSIACIFHDVIYDTRKQDNEKLSARYAVNTMKKTGIDTGIIDRVAELIVSTADHKPADGSYDSRLFLDADLSVLGSGASGYLAYSGAIRQEYSWLRDEEYCRGRYGILKKFLARERIYLTDDLYRDFESRARKNIAGEMENLMKGRL